MVTDLTFDPPLGVKWNFWGELFFLSAKGVYSSVLRKFGTQKIGIPQLIRG